MFSERAEEFAKKNGLLIGGGVLILLIIIVVVVILLLGGSEENDVQNSHGAKQLVESGSRGGALSRTTGEVRQEARRRSVSSRAVTSTVVTRLYLFVQRLNLVSTTVHEYWEMDDASGCLVVANPLPKPFLFLNPVDDPVEFAADVMPFLDGSGALLSQKFDISGAEALSTIGLCASSGFTKDSYEMFRVRFLPSFSFVPPIELGDEKNVAVNICIDNAFVTLKPATTDHLTLDSKQENALTFILVPDGGIVSREHFASRIWVKERFTGKWLRQAATSRKELILDVEANRDTWWTRRTFGQNKSTAFVPDTTTYLEDYLDDWQDENGGATPCTESHPGNFSAEAGTQCNGNDEDWPEFDALYPPPP